MQKLSAEANVASHPVASIWMAMGDRIQRKEIAFSKTKTIHYEFSLNSLANMTTVEVVGYDPTVRLPEGVGTSKLELAKSLRRTKRSIQNYIQLLNSSRIPVKYWGYKPGSRWLNERQVETLKLLNAVMPQAEDKADALYKLAMELRDSDKYCES